MDDGFEIQLLKSLSGRWALGEIGHANVSSPVIILQNQVGLVYRRCVASGKLSWLRRKSIVYRWFSSPKTGEGKSWLPDEFTRG